MNLPNKLFFRVGNTATNQGLWYDQEGNFTGLIHNELNFCSCSEVLMNFDEEVSGYLSCTESLEDLYIWFSKEDLKSLKEHGYEIYLYSSEDYTYYDRFEHYLINQKTSKIIGKICPY